MSERGEASRIGARQQKNSGRGKIQKGDITLEIGGTKFVGDIKEFSKSFGLSVDVWTKICTDTFKTDSDASPLLYLVLGEGNRKVRLAVIEYAILEGLLNE